MMLIMKMKETGYQPAEIWLSRETLQKGRPRKRWRDVLEDDLKKDSLDRGLAKDRQMEGSDYEDEGDWVSACRNMAVSGNAGKKLRKR